MNPQVFSKFLTKKWKNRQSIVIISGGKKGAKNLICWNKINSV